MTARQEELPLNSALKDGDVEMVSALLRYGALLAIMNKRGVSAANALLGRIEKGREREEAAQQRDQSMAKALMVSFEIMGRTEYPD